MAAWRWRWAPAHVLSAWPAAAIRFPSSCPAIASWRAAARRAATRVARACRPSAGCSLWKAWCFFRPSTLRRADAPATESAMRVLITRPEREATALATALTERGHAPVIAPLFQLETLTPPPDFAASLASAQVVLLSSANGARAL